IVFGGVIALGFATVENVLYYGNGLNSAYESFGFSSKALMSFLVLFTLRGIFSPFAHATFTSMTGIGCGFARESHNVLVKIIMPVLGYILAVFLHFVWNSMGIAAMIILKGLGIEGVCTQVGLGGGNIGLCSFFSAYFILEVPLFLIFVTFALFIMRRQRKILTEMLAIDIARGLIPQEDATTATSAFKSSKWILGGLFSGKFKARNRYVRAIGKLGLSYWHIQRATAAQGQTGSFQQNPILRDEVLKWRDQV
ncbi:MAG: PrsW family intramembrane metalloprotease, partial [Acidobacteriota bacterium]